VILIHQRHRQTDRQTDRRTDGQHAISIPRYALVHRAVKTVPQTCGCNRIGLRSVTDGGQTSASKVRITFNILQWLDIYTLEHMRAASCKHSLLSVYVDVCMWLTMYVRMSASLRLNILETKGATVLFPIWIL